MFEPMTQIIPEGERCGIRVEHHVVTEHEAAIDALRSLGKRVTPIAPGPVCCLYVGHVLMMSDGVNEHDTNRAIVREARGDVLIAGLGLGMILIPILRKPDVRSVTVLELGESVIELVELHIRRHVGEALANKLSVINADARQWMPPKGTTYDVIYFDIWPTISTDNLPAITKFKRRFARRLRPGGWMGAWVERQLRAHKQRNARNRRRWW